MEKTLDIEALAEQMPDGADLIAYGHPSETIIAQLDPAAMA